MERFLPVPILWCFLLPYALARALTGPRLPVGPWPACLGTKPGTLGTWQSLTSHHLDRALRYLPDRVSSPRWRERCQIVGAERIKAARKAGRPVMLAICHFGPFILTGLWLRAFGMPVTGMILRTAGVRSRTDRRRDNYLPHPQIPGYLHADQLREIVRLVSAGGTLVVAIDFPSGRQELVPGEAGWSFRMATGAIRLAARHSAELIPCHIIHEGLWRFRIELGRPVPREHLSGEPDFVAVGKHLLAEALPYWRRHPEQCHPHLLQSFQQETPPRP
jgi:lauroyl/myristoyl acyltransferase